MLTLEAKILGRPGSPNLVWELPLSPEDLQHPISLRSLIEKVVRQEAASFRARQSQQQLSQVLTTQELAQAITRGKIISGGQDLSQQVDETSAIQAAWQAFEDGLFLVFVDEQQIHSLDQDVVLQAKSRLTFIRLVALAGG